MAEKCWCEESLVKGGVYTAGGEWWWECPVHGRNWRLSRGQVIALVKAVKADLAAENEEIRVRDMRRCQERDAALERSGGLRWEATRARDAALAALPPDVR